jgi:membrane-bound lytic murein transglycosylase B
MSTIGALRRLAPTVLLALCAVPLHAAEGPVSREARIDAFVEDLVVRHGFERAALGVLLDDATSLPGIVERISRPAERTLSWAEYRRIFLGADRVEEGVRFLIANEDTLLRVEAQYGVPPEYVVAILGVETRFGARTGDWRVLDALYTLGFDYPPRADFFRRELEQFLLLAREEGRDARTLSGSYAGAMGWGQFIPSSYRAYAVDFDADGVRDIWTNPVDAMGSVANYFAEHGWAARAPVLRRVAIDDAENFAGIANRGLELRSTVAELRALGARGLEGLDDGLAAGLWRVDGPDGEAFYATFGNFRAITRYNHSHLYALAVHDLAQAILAGSRTRAR